MTILKAHLSAVSSFDKKNLKETTTNEKQFLPTTEREFNFKYIFKMVKNSNWSWVCFDTSQPINPYTTCGMVLFITQRIGCNGKSLGIYKHFNDSKIKAL